MFKRIIAFAAFALMPALGACDLDMTGIGDAVAEANADCWSSMGCDNTPWFGGEPLDYPTTSGPTAPDQPGSDD